MPNAPKDVILRSACFRREDTFACPCRSQPRGPLVRRPLLEKCLSFGAVHESFEDDRAILNARQRSGRNRQVITDEIKFRDFDLRRKVQLVGMRNLHLASLRHGSRLKCSVVPSESSLWVWAGLPAVRGERSQHGSARTERSAKRSVG